MMGRVGLVLLGILSATGAQAADFGVSRAAFECGLQENTTARLRRVRCDTGPDTVTCSYGAPDRTVGLQAQYSTVKGAVTAFTLAYQPGAWAEAGRTLDEVQAVLAIPAAQRLDGRAIARRELEARNVATDAIRCVTSPTPVGQAGLRLSCAARSG